MHEFTLYHLTNIEAEQMVNLMKRAALLLGFIKGPNVKNWVKRWANWTIKEFNTGHVSTDKFYWTEVSQGFQQVFQETGARERAEDKLHHLTFIPGEIDTFIAQFESLAEKPHTPLRPSWLSPCSRPNFLSRWWTISSRWWDPMTSKDGPRPHINTIRTT